MEARGSSTWGRLAWAPALALALAYSGQAGGADGAAAIVGVWRGTSICTDRTVAPACKDEEIIYTFTTAKESAATVLLHADKVVKGEVVPMGDLEFTYQESSKTWTCDMKTERFHGVWTYTVAGAALAGTLVDVPTGATIRRIAAHRE